MKQTQSERVRKLRQVEAPSVGCEAVWRTEIDMFLSSSRVQKLLKCINKIFSRTLFSHILSPTLTPFLVPQHSPGVLQIYEFGSKVCEFKDTLKALKTL